MTLQELSPDQEVARQAVLDALAGGSRDLVLAGAAGTGKTTLMRQLIADLEAAGYTVRLVAPTGKAASRLSALTGKPATTIHSPLYKTIKETVNAEGKKDGGVEFADPKAIASGRSVVICDEASMVGQRIHRDLRGKLPADVALLYVGDREQLEPVNDTWGADFASPTALLDKIHRQAEGSPIVQLATAIRQAERWRSIRPTGEGYRVQRATLEQAAAWLSLERACGGDATLLAYTNRVRQRTNGLVREQRGHTAALEIGDVIVCTRNAYNLGLMNGEVRQVADFEPVDGSGGQLVAVRWVEGGRDTWHNDGPILAPHTLATGMTQPELERLDALCDALDDAGDDPFGVFERGPMKRRILQAEYGECLTVHKSQGSQWHSVGIVFDGSFEGMEERDPAAFRRLLYTAVTRAARELVIFDVGRC